MGKDELMTVKWMGAVLILTGCGGMGFAVAAASRREENLLRQLIAILDYMQCELQYHLTPLPELCQQAGVEAGGILGEVFGRISQNLNNQITADVSEAVSSALKEACSLPAKPAKAFSILGRTLGKFDLDGQIRGLEATRALCRRELEAMGVNRDNRLRSYQTLGLCAGAALAILFV